MFSFEILYDIKFRNPLLIIIKTSEFQKEIDFMKKKRQICFDVIDVVKLAQVKMSILFDKKHRSFHLKKKIYLKLIKIKRIDYHVSNQFFLTAKKLESFVIKRKMNDLAYELILSSFMRIHFVISVIHFDQTRKNTFERSISLHAADPKSESIIVDGEKYYVVEKFLKTEIRNEKFDFIVKWKNYEKRIWKFEKKMKKKTFLIWSKNFESKKKKKNLKRLLNHHYVALIWHHKLVRSYFSSLLMNNFVKIISRRTSQSVISSSVQI